MIKKLCIVLAHGGARETVVRHMPFWERLHDEVWVSSPVDDPLIWDRPLCIVHGKSGRYDARTNIRTRQLMRLAYNVECVWLTFVEYDAILWKWPEQANTMPELAAMGSVFQNADPKFKGSFYVHSPIIFRREAIRRTLAAMTKLPDTAEYGFGDRYFGLAMEEGAVKVIDGHALGISYSQNHIEQKHWADARAKIAAGACFSHGIKDAQTLQRLASALPR